MTTSVVNLTDAWAEVVSGAGYISKAKEDQHAATLPLHSERYDDSILWHVGTVAPAANSFAYHEYEKPIEYMGTQKIFMRCKVSGATATVKVSPIV